MQMLGWLYMPSVCAYQSLMPRAIVASFLNNVESKTYIVVFQTGLGLTREPNPNPNGQSQRPTLAYIRKNHSSFVSILSFTILALRSM